jgi:anti-sigma B factor antagonist
MVLAESSSVTSRRGPVAFPVRDADRTVVWLRGEHDVSTVAALSQTMARAIALDDGDLVVDLSDVQFMDAATVGVIIRARDFLRLQSRSLALRSPSSCAARILDLCDLADLLEPRPEHATRARASAGALGVLVAVPASDRIETMAAPSGGPADLQQRARRGDVALLSLLRLDERTNAHRHSLAKKTVARLRVSRSSRSTRFARPS